MKIVRLYNSVVLPNSQIYLRGDHSKSLDGSILEINDEVVIILSKKKNVEEITKEAFYDFGVTGKVVDKENGISVIEIYNRVKLECIDDLGEGKYEIKITGCDTNHDISEEDEKNKLNKIKNELISFVGKYEWGLFARTYIMQWNNFL